MSSKFNFKEFSIKKKIILIIIFISFIVLFISSSSFFAVQYTTTENNKTEHVMSISALIAKNITAALVFKDIDAANEMLSSLEYSPTIKQALVLDDKREIFSILRSDGLKFDLNKIDTSNKSTYRDDNLLVVIHPVVLEGKSVGAIIIADDLQDFKHQVITYLIVAIAVFLASLLIALILSAELQQLITGQISQLTEIAEKVITQENYSLRAHKTSNDEIGDLVDNFNKILSKLGIQRREIKDLKAKVEEDDDSKSAKMNIPD